MQKNLIIIITFLSFIVSCKKDTKVEPTNTEPSERYKMITSHYWRLTEKWQDTTFYGLNIPSFIPLSSSTQVYYPVDSCQYYSSSKYSSNGWYYSVKKNGCSGCSSSHCEVFENIPWSLSQDGKILNGASGSFNIITINDTMFKHYDFAIYNFNIKTITVRVYKAINYQ